MKACNSILLVDDDDVNNAINVKLINHLGLSENIHICKNGLDASLYLRMLDMNKLPLPELIILDLDMRVMNGYEFLREYKTMHFIPKGEIKIIVVTNMNSNRDKITIESLGIDFIEKPLTKEKLLSCLRYEEQVKN